MPLSQPKVPQRYLSHKQQLGGAAQAVTPSDTADLTVPDAILFIGVGGDVSVDTYDGQQAVVFKNMPSGSILPVRVNRVRSTSTTATNMVAVY